ncbi:dihydroneopterin aldolase [Desulfofarcimen acetoxidans DSM 771]|uniref:7,8-dihydroneopterin aldolase n=1 Tax=Desulfofarcimen acetoxidans (strain ATCC 49208 / DSM 771 / KCTC 5769 / VKM B-1644 / 5575) TaxID=485916 RepID=C8W3T5_DESAS|nr:dihydroneopterin aldolase [Desulfofarcimen acetoxidans]ACV61189.1 dihydroneopterin aldolase [Desulfofarcimen acetoxidans DSM 771]
MSDKIILSGLDFYGYHGVLPEEQRLGQKFIIDLELSLSLREAGIKDDPDLTVNYARVFETVREVVVGKPFFLIEALAEAIAFKVLKNFSIEKVLVRVRKPQAPVPGCFEHMAVEITREKEV